MVDATAQKSTKTVPGNDGEKNMSEMNLFYIRGDTAQDLEGGQNREWPEMIRHQNQRRCCA
jgi:hypothetical protein